MNNVYVWDFPTRLFHWLLVLSLCFQYISGDILDDAIDLHFYVGYFVIGLILFRIIWGFVGFYYSRFSTFLYSPKKAALYITGKDTKHYLSHNPIGGYSVVVMLTLIGTQAVSGLFMTDDIFTDGPYYSSVSSSTADIASWIHHNFFDAIIAIVVLHIAAIIVYKVKGYPLVAAMFTGRKQGNDLSLHTKRGLWLRFLLVAFFVAALIYLVVEVLPPEPDMYDF